MNTAAALAAYHCAKANDESMARLRLQLGRKHNAEFVTRHVVFALVVIKAYGNQSQRAEAKKLLGRLT